MLYKEIFRILGNYLFGLALILCLPLAVALYYEFIALPTEYPQLSSSLQFLETIVITIALGFLFRLFGRKATGQIFRRESIVIAVGIWLISAVISALPFYLTHTLEKPVDAFFEAMSGLTTTGASMMEPKKFDADTGQEIPITITNKHVPGKVYTYWGTITPVRDASGKIIASGMQAVSKAVLFWRSFIQWLGGMGIVVLFLTVLPALGVGGKFLYQTEVPGPVKETITPRIRDTASLLWKIYLGVTLIQVILLLWTNQQMPVFDSICIAFSTLSTGGFTVVDNSIANYNNAATDWVIIAFMIIGSINFGLYFHIIRGKFYRIYSPDFFLFVTSVVIGSFLVSAYVVGLKTASFSGTSETYSLSDAIRQGSFQAVSAQTSTGFATANYDLWPFPSQMFMLLLMFFGGMSGATCGGIKTTRFYLLYKILIHRIEAIFRPETVRRLRIGTAEIDPNRANTVLSFFCIVLFATLLGTLSYIINGIDPETSLGLTACMLNNIGMAFRAAGPASSFNFMSDFSKIMSTFWMLVGRLEFFAVLLLFIPAFWRGK